jgi:hypothetical protein
MQTSGNGSSISRPAGGRTTRAAGVGLAIGAVVMVTGAWISCSPGELNCDKVTCPNGSGGSGGGEAGSGGGGGSAAAGGSGGGGGTAPSECDSLGVKTPTDFETKFIVAKCSTSMCHGPTSAFFPKGLSQQSMIRSLLVGKKGQLYCKNDYYINKTDPSKSFVLAKISADGDMVTCPSGGAGGLRMPNAMPAVVGPKLGAD